MIFIKKLRFTRSTFLLFFFCLLLVQCDQKDTYDIVVIGGGLMGSSVAWQLSKEHKKILLLEKQSKEYDQGSSNGEARIARSLGPKNDMWSMLHNLNVSEVSELVSFLNQKEDDLHEMGDVFTTSPVSYVRHFKQLARIEKMATSSQSDSFLFAKTTEEGRRLFDADLPDSTIMIREFKQHSGTINPAVLIGKLHQAVQLYNNDIWYNTSVDKITRISDGFELELTSSNKSKVVIRANKVVSAAGPYTGQLLKEVAPYFDTLITPQRVFLAFLKIKRKSWAALSEPQIIKLTDGYPVINSSRGTRSTGFFSMIERWENHTPIIKIGGHFQRKDIQDLDKVWYQGVTEEEVAWAIKSTAHYFTQLDLPLSKTDLEVADEYSCVYSLSQTEVPYVTNAILNNGEIDQNLIVMGAMSGVGAKGALAYGKLASRLLLQQVDQLGPLQQAYDKMGSGRLLSDIAIIRK